MEMHLVHWKTSYGNITNAKSYPDGLAVLAVLFNAQSTSNEEEEEMEVIRMMRVVVLKVAASNKSILRDNSFEQLNYSAHG
jgi:hypothetical protein